MTALAHGNGTSRYHGRIRTVRSGRSPMRTSPSSLLRPFIRPDRRRLRVRRDRLGRATPGFARLVAAPMLVATLAMTVGLPALAGAATPAPASGSGTNIAADYFGTANPLNFWSSDISGAMAAFQQMKSDGFNTVGLVLPWGDFEPKVSPARFDSAALGRLKTLISTAQLLHMQVILRLSYDWDIDPSDQLPGIQRVDAAYGQAAVYQSWLGYISKIRQTVAAYPNVHGAYLSWEDFWYPVGVAQEATTSTQRLQLATSVGYQSWLKRTHSLANISRMYGTRFTSWSQVPTPSYSSPSFRLMYEFGDSMMVNRFFLPAQKRFPGLTIESRVDVDPIYNGHQVVGSYTHTAQYRLPGTSVTGMYFSPYMGDPSSAIGETAPQAVDALQTTLSSMSSKTGGRPLFIYEYEIVSNSPAVANDPNLTPNQVGPFLAQSAPLLKKYTKGFALWTYRDFTMSSLFNPSFSLGQTGWTFTGETSVTAPAGSTSYLTMGTNSSVAQATTPTQLPPGAPVTLSVEAAATSGKASLSVKVGSAAPQVITVGPGWNSYSIQVPQSALSVGTVSLSASAPLSLSDVQLYAFTQVGDVYSANGTPGVALAPLRAMNQQLTALSSGS